MRNFIYQIGFKINWFFVQKVEAGADKNVPVGLPPKSSSPQLCRLGSLSFELFNIKTKLYGNY